MTAFSVTWDYRCPFARNAHEHLLAGLADGADWDVTFVPFSLNQAHVPEGGEPVWDDPTHAPDLLAPSAAVVVRDEYPEQFAAVHQALFTARHDTGLDLREADVVAKVLAECGLDSEAVLARVATGEPRAEIRRAHEQAVSELSVFGVPTFIIDDKAVFVRLMSRPRGDGALARRTIDGVLQVMEDQPDLNEYKFTTISR